MSRLSRRLRAEDGWAVVTAVFVTMLTIGLGLTALTVADVQTRQSGNERVGESSFNLGEGALNSQIFVLSQLWPGSSNAAFPDCGSAFPADSQCPGAARVAESFDASDYGANTSWSTIVRDNGGAAGTLFYDETVTPAQPSWDANADNRMWVRAQASVRGKRRTLVALVKVDETAENFPKNVITAGKVQVLPSGRQVYIDTGQSNVQLRCSFGLLGPSPDDVCGGYEPAKGQIGPGSVEQQYSGGNAVSDDALFRLKKRAQADGTYCGPEGTPNTSFCNAVTRCPLDAQLNKPGAVVYVVPSSDGTPNGPSCQYANAVKPCCGTESSPEVLIFERGTLKIESNLAFYGLIYMANKQNSSAQNVLELRGGMTLNGAAAVDGEGGVQAGSNGLNIVYDPNVFNSLISYGTAGIIRNTLREVPG